MGLNDTCLAALSMTLYIKYKVKFDLKKRRIYYLGYIINLLLSAFLFADNKEALEEAIKILIKEEGDVIVYKILIKRLKEIKGKKKKQWDNYLG